MPLFLRLIASASFLVVLCASLSAQNPAAPTAADHFAEGLRHISQRRYNEAIDSFKKSGEMDGSRPETHANIGNAYLALNDLDKAETAFRKAIEVDPNNGRWHTSLCSSLSLQKKHADALRACEEGVRLSPDLDYTHAGRMSAIYESGERTNQLRQLIEAALGRFRHSSLILELGVKFYLSEGNFAQTVVLLEQLIAINPTVVAYHGQLADSYLKTGRDLEALASARKALDIEPENPFGNYVMGLIFFELGQHEEAAAAMVKVLSADPDFDDAKYVLAISESRRSRFIASIGLLNELAQKDPANHLYHIQLGRDFGSLDRFAEAEAAYLKANALLPRNIEILSGIGLANMSMAKFDRAIAFFDEGLAVQPGNEMIQMFLRVARNRRDMIPRIPSMIESARQRPDDLRLLFDLVNSLAFAGRIDEAEVIVQKIYKIAPQDPALYQRLGVSFSEAGRKENAIDAYQRSLAVRETPDAHLGMASIYVNDGNFAAASASFARVIELKPETPGIIHMYANLLRDNGKRHEALEMYKRSLALQAGNAPVVFNAGMMSMKLGQRDEALNYLEMLRSLDPQLAKTLDRCLKLRLWG